MIHFVLPAGFDWTVRDYLAHRGRNVANRFHLISYEDLPTRTEFEQGTYVLVAFERLSPAMLRFVEELYRELSHAEGIRFLNHPTRTLTRFALLDALRRSGRNEFRAARAAGDLTGLRYPVFVRSERSHDGALSPLLHSHREIDAAIGRALLAGRALEDLLVVEFCDTADGSGYYRKYSAFIVGNRILARNLEIARGWVVKDSGREFSRPALVEERDFVLGNPHARQLAEIFEIAGVGYGRIDYALKDGRVQTWEINSHPTIGPAQHPSPHNVPEELRPIREESKDHFYRGFEEAWKAIDVTPNGRPAVSVALDGAGLRARPAAGSPGRPVFGAARRALRPLRPMLDSLATPLLPWLGRLARRVASRPFRAEN